MAYVQDAEKEKQVMDIRRVVSVGQKLEIIKEKKVRQKIGEKDIVRGCAFFATTPYWMGTKFAKNITKKI